MSLVDRIKAAASEKGLTLAGIEKTLGFGNSTIRKWDKNSPSLDKVIATANLLNVSVSWLAPGIPDDSIEIKYSTFLNKYEKLDASDKIKIDHFMEICLLSSPATPVSHDTAENVQESHVTQEN